MADGSSPSPERAPHWLAWATSIVNGVVGDYLHEQQNGLAIAMAFYAHDRPLKLDRASVIALHPQPTSKICVLVHGLACNEGVWRFPHPEQPEQFASYGTLLQHDFGFTPFFVRYNTGMSILSNGTRLAGLLSELVACYPLPISEIVLIGHSMGGLVIRSACHHDLEGESAWVNEVSEIFYLGTPHEGAILAGLGHVATSVLHAVPHPITRLIGDILNIRSQGVKDLRPGGPLHSAGPTRHAATDQPHQRGVPWLAHANHYLIVGTITANPNHAAAILFGDGLVTLPSLSRSPAHLGAVVPIQPDHVKILPRTNHLQLAHDPTVYVHIKQWCMPD